MKLFLYTLEKDSKLMECYSTIPKNATSAAMQNEIIELLRRHTVSLVVDEIKCSDVPYFTLKCDGTRDLSNTENLAIVIRYLKNGRVLEKLAAMPTTQHYDAETLADLIIKDLTNLCIDPKRMLSQCYDGASVMSGKIALVLSKFLNIIRPVYKQLQSHKCDIYHGLGLLKIAKIEIAKLRNSLIFDEILKQMSQFNIIVERIRRKACESRRFSDYVVEALIPSQVDWITFHRKIYFAIIDGSLGELDNRFSEQNDSIYSSLASLLPTSETFLNFDALKPLSNLVNCDKSALLSELTVAKAYISKQNMMTLLNILGSLPTCESSFSTLTRIMTPFRRNMKHQRKSSLVILASLSKYKSSIGKDDFLNFLPCAAVDCS
uniref:Uncharacterized protein n=1 Tax=Octopus bimaculoides TaxID=37653 RepID=A0A0L8HTI7_OCTBM